MIRSDFLMGAGTMLATGVTAPFSQNGVLQQFSIGVNVPLSGPLAEYGKQIVSGVQAAVNEANRYNSTLMRAWGIRTFDDQNTIAVATSNAFVAAADPGVIAMVGNLTTDVTLAALEQYRNASFACVVPALTADVITSRGFRNVFRLPTKDSSEGRLFARAVLQGKKATVVRAIWVEGEYGADTARAFVAQAKADKHDADLVAMETTSDPQNTAAIALRPSPTYIFLSGKPDRLGAVVHALRSQGYKGEFGASDGFFTTAITEPYGKLMSGSLVATSLPPIERVPTNTTLLADLHGDVGDVTAFSAYGYAAGQLIISAAGRANAKDRFQLLTQLQQRGSYTLLVGQYQFDFNGDATLPEIYLFRITDTGFDYVRPAQPNGFVS
jgi:branched-chain amino acid transport system substrate-binding protein